MANDITAHTIVNGPRNLILQFNITADGSGDYSDFILLDADDYGPNISDIRVKKVSGRVGVGTTAQLLFGAVTNDSKLFFETSTDNEFSEDWTSVGCLSPKHADPDKTVRLTTAGFDASGDSIDLVIWLKKANRRNVS